MSVRPVSYPIDVPAAAVAALRDFFAKNRSPKMGYTPMWIADFCDTRPLDTLLALAYLLEAGEIQAEIHESSLVWTFSRKRPA